MDLATFIRGEMERYTGKSLASARRVLVRCPFHNDSTPSLVVTLVKSSRGVPGAYTCFGCGASSKTEGGWDGLASKLRLRPIDPNAFESEFNGSAFNISAFNSTGLTLQDLYDEWGFEPRKLKEGYTFRGIEYPLLKRLKAVPGIDGFGFASTVFPLWVGGELVGGVKAKNRPKKKDPFRYLNFKGSWSRISGLFPMHYKKKWDRVILVEGPRDALTLLQYGLPALSILGTNSWSDEKRDLLLASGVRQVLVAMDGDEAGRKGAAIIMSSLSGIIPRAKLVLPDEEDPGSLPRKFWQQHTPNWFMEE